MHLLLLYGIVTKYMVRNDLDVAFQDYSRLQQVNYFFTSNLKDNTYLVLVDVCVPGLLLFLAF